jgi:hypothetical protein
MVSVKIRKSTSGTLNQCALPYFDGFCLELLIAKQTEKAL